MLCDVEGHLCTLGIPAELVSDNTSHFSSSEFKFFFQSSVDLHVMSNRQYLPYANKEAQQAVQIAKYILKHNDP